MQRLVWGVALRVHYDIKLLYTWGLGKLRFSLTICTRFLANLVCTFLVAEISSKISSRPEKSICDSNSRASPDILQKQKRALRLFIQGFEFSKTGQKSPRGRPSALTFCKSRMCHSDYASEILRLASRFQGRRGDFKAARPRLQFC